MIFAAWRGCRSSALHQRLEAKTSRRQGATPGRLVARTGSGDLDAAPASPPRTVELRTGSGDLSLRLPEDGTTACAVSSRTGSGDEDVRVRSDPSSPSTLSAATGSGDLRVSY